MCESKKTKLIETQQNINKFCTQLPDFVNFFCTWFSVHINNDKSIFKKLYKALCCR